MIDLQQYRMCVGCFYYKIPVCGTSRGKGYYILNHLLAIGIECSVAICLTLNILLLLCGDIEVNSGPKGMKICLQCKQYLSTRQNICKCGHTFNKKGRPVGTTQATGYEVSKGCPIGTTCSTGCVIGSGCPVGTTVDAGFNALGGRPIGTTLNAGFNVTSGCPIGTNFSAGYNVSGGRPVGATVNSGAKSPFSEDDPSKLAKHVQQYELPIAWDTDKCNLSTNESMLSSARKYIAK